MQAKTFERVDDLHPGEHFEQGSAGLEHCVGMTSLASK